MGAANIPDTSFPGSQVGPPFSPAWIYDFDPATGSARATFNGEVRFSTGGSSTAGVTSWNGRTGSVALETADLTALDALFNPSPALQGVPTAPTAAAATSTTQVATCQFVQQAVAAGAGVTAFNGRTGAVSLSAADVSTAGGLVNPSPAMTGVPTAPTPAPTDNSSAVATTAYVQNVIAGQAVASFNGRRGVVSLTLGDVTSVGGAPLASPQLTGVPTSTNPPVGDASTRIATTEFVTNAVISGQSGVVSFNTRQGAVTLQSADISGAGGALLAGPQFTGQPEAPTPPAGDASTRLATTQFVETAIGSMAPLVTSWNGRTGAVTLSLSDIETAGGAPLASPALTGVPTVPTATAGTNTTQAASCQFVETALAAVPSGVSSVNGRQGAVTIVGSDISGAGGALLAAPALTGAATLNGSPITTTATLGTALAGYLPLSGGTLTGNLSLTSPAGLTVGGNAQFNQAVGFAGAVGITGILTMSSVINANAGMNTTNINTTSMTASSTVTANGGIIAGGHGVQYPSWSGNFVGLQWTGSASFNAYVDGNFEGAINLSGSDQSLKENFEPLTVDCLGIVNEIALQQFDWKERGGVQRPHASCGFTAQGLRELIPEAVTDPAVEGSFLVVDLMPLVAYLIGAVQRLSERLENVEKT